MDSKPTIFFSHSSKDKNAILEIKNKIDSITSGVLDIFMSSDGQSIPFGTNWIYKIEEGLKAAKVMFVFVTEISVSSGWIYFEAGYAYSKGIQVVPVGLGIDIGTLKAPLNLLQGFNIISEESLNNFITIINRTFNYHFNATFDKSNFFEIMSLTAVNNCNIIKIEEAVKKIEYCIYSEYKVNGSTQTYDLEAYIKTIIAYLDKNSIKYAKEDKFDNAGNTCIMVYGIKILYRKAKKNPQSTYHSQDDLGKISFQISPYNFIQSFEVFKKLLIEVAHAQTYYLRVFLKDNYKYTEADEDCASLLASSREFDFNESHVGGYIFNNLNFYLFNEILSLRTGESKRLMSIVFDCHTVSAQNIIELINRLREIGLITNL